MELEQMSSAELISLVRRQEQELAVARESVQMTAAELSCVINWLEGGRDPKDAAKELRLYCERAWTGAQHGGNHPGIPDSSNSAKNSSSSNSPEFEGIKTDAQQGGGELPQDEWAALSSEVTEHCWKMYQQGQVSADHSAKEVFVQTLQSLATWLAQRAASVPAQVGQQKMVDVDSLAQFIRMIDGNNTIGAGVLAEKISEWLAAWPEVFSAPVPAASVQPTAPTDISARLREYAGNPGYSHNDYADTMRTAASECERFYGGMIAWKETAQQKDRTIIDLRAQLHAQQPDIGRDAALDNESLFDAIIALQPESSRHIEYKKGHDAACIAAADIVLSRSPATQAAPSDAGRDAALEEAATVVEQKKVDAPSYFEINDYLQEAADAIRALAAHPANVAQPEFHVTETHGTALVDTVRGQATLLGEEVREYTIPAASVQYTVDDMIEQYRHGFAACKAVQPDRGRDAALDKTIKERDYNEAFADQLAGCIADYFGVDIGEHSSGNCPWTEALRVIEEAGAPAVLTPGKINVIADDLFLWEALPKEWGSPKKEGMIQGFARAVLAAAAK